MNSEILERHKNINRGFRKLEIWRKAIIIYEMVCEILNKNKEIPFKTKSQVEDSALSISSNIAEGYSRRSIKETLRFYEIGLASAAENYSQLFALYSTQRVSQDDFDKYDALHYELENKIISMNKSLIFSLKNQGVGWETDYQ